MHSICNSSKNLILVFSTTLAIKAQTYLKPLINFLNTYLDTQNAKWKYLTPKGPRPFFCEKTLKTAISTTKNKKNLKFFFCTSNHRILHLPSMRMCGKNFRNFDHIDCKISIFKVKKMSFSTHCRTRLLTLNPFNFNFLHYRVLSLKSLWW